MNIQPSPVDWRRHGAISGALRDQGFDPTCWLMAGVGALEYAIRISTGTDTQIGSDIIERLRTMNESRRHDQVRQGGSLEAGGWITEVFHHLDMNYGNLHDKH